MLVVFYLAGAIAIAATVMAITRLHAVHALLYFIVSLLAMAVVFYVLGAPFVAALEVIIYAGAIVVLFVFAVMMLNLGEAAATQERLWLHRRMWIGPTILAGMLVTELLYMLGHPGSHAAGIRQVEPQQVGLALFGPYVIGVELAAMLLLAGLVGAYHIGQRHHVEAKQVEERHERDWRDGVGAGPSGSSHGTRVIAGEHPVRAGADGPVGAA